MSELPSLVKDLALILAVASIVTLLFKKLKQPLVLGYIVAGFLVSPHMPYTMSVMDKTDIQTWADIGVIFLLFAIHCRKYYILLDARTGIYGRAHRRMDSHGMHLPGLYIRSMQ